MHASKKQVFNICAAMLVIIIICMPLVSGASCPVINTSGTYTATENLSGAPNDASPLAGTACVKIAASNVTFDCNGFNITNNGTGGDTYGILLNGSLTNVTVKNCPGISGYTYGIAAESSNNSAFINNTAYNNSNGFYLDSSSNNTLRDGHCFNNTADFRILAGGSAISVNVSNIIFDNPYGNYQNFTNLSLNDGVETGDSYSITWSPSPAAPPGSYPAFANKFVNISALSGVPSIDSIVWNWNSNDSAGYNESRFSLWKYNASGWNVMNNSPDTIGNTLSLSGLSSFSTFGIFRLEDTMPPGITLVPPTPQNNSSINYQNAVINVTVSENASQCTLFVSDPSKLWSNLRHLNISGGAFDYNASIGVNNYSSFNMMNRNPIAAGNSHTCYLLSNGNSSCYGNNGYGQSTSYTGGDAIAISTSFYTTCYLLASGNSTCYGLNWNGTGPTGQTTAYTGGNAIAVSAGYYHTCYLLASGNSQCYGQNNVGQSTNYAGGNAVAISTSFYTTCYLLASGNSQCYGANNYNQSTNYTGGNAIAVSAAGTYHTCYLLSNGNSTCYGLNNSGSTNSYAGGNAIAVSSGTSHTCYLLSSGNSACYGLNTSGSTNSYAGGNAIAVSAGYEYTCYLLSSGISTCYGDNFAGKATNYTGGNIKMPFTDVSYAMEVHNAGNLTTANYALPSLPDGNYAFLANCTDLAGNSNTTETRNAIIDTENPTIQFTSPTTNTSAYSMLNYISANVTASDTNLKNITIYIYNSTGLYNSTNGTASSLFINWTGLPDGAYSFNATAYDSAGNLNNTETRNVTIDTVNPMITFTTPTDNSSATVSRSYVQINATTTDSGSGLNNITVYLYNSTGALINSSNGTESPLLANFSVDADGVYYFNATAYDNANNANSTETRSVMIDTEAPAVTVTSPGGSIDSNSFTLSFTVNDTNLDRCWYSLDNGTNVALPNCTGTTVSSSYGNHCVTVYANDTAGNLNSSQACFNLYRSHVSSPTPEEPQPSPPPQNQTLPLHLSASVICVPAGMGDATVTATSNGSAVPSVALAVSGIGGTSYTDSGGKGTFPGLLDGEFTVSGTKDGYDSAQAAFSVSCAPNVSMNATPPQPNMTANQTGGNASSNQTGSTKPPSGGGVIEQPQGNLSQANVSVGPSNVTPNATVQPGQNQTVEIGGGILGALKTDTIISQAMSIMVSASRSPAIIASTAIVAAGIAWYVFRVKKIGQAPRQ